MRISQFTFLGFYLNGAQGTGKYNDITIEQIKEQLSSGKIFSFLQDRLGTDIDTSIFSEQEKVQVIEEWNDMAIAINERRKLCVDNGGLCLLVAYCLESIQRINAGNK